MCAKSLQSCWTLCDPMNCSLQGSSCPWGFSRQEYCSGLPCPLPGDLPNPGIEPMSPTLQADYLPAEPSRKPKSTGVGRLSLLQQIFPNPELNRGLPHCRQILLLLSLPSNIIEDVNYYHYSSYTVI